MRRLYRKGVKKITRSGVKIETIQRPVKIILPEVYEIDVKVDDYVLSC